MMAFFGSLKIITGILVFLSVLQVTHAFWWYLGLTTPEQVILDKTARNPCDSLEFLEPYQRTMCNKNERLIGVMRKGALMSFRECQNNFANRRWNCPIYNETSVFGKILDTKNRFTAYIYALTSAGFTYSVTKACARGEIENCGCTVRSKAWVSKDVHTYWDKSKCSDDVISGSRFSEEFLDAAEADKGTPGKMNLWNNGVGREVVKKSLRLQCKCVGPTFSCTSKICWEKMSSFQQIAEDLKKKFKEAIRVDYDKKENSFKAKSYMMKKPKKGDLIYLKPAGNNCDFSFREGSLGTRGRECNKTSLGLDGCDLMCCGRGYRTLVKTVQAKCNCKFHWCCHTECEMCSKQVEINYCK